MVFKWKEDHTPIVLNLLEDRQCLWNSKTSEYKSKSNRNNALADIVKEINLPGVTVEDVKLKIKTIRTRYSSELTKVLKSQYRGRPTEPGDIYVPKLFWYKQADSFLRSVCVPRISVSSAVLRNIRDSAMGIENEDDNFNQQSDFIEEDIDSEKNELKIEESCIEPPQASVKRKKIPKNDLTIPRNETFSGFQPGENSVNKLNNISNENKPDSENEFDIFCRSLAVQLSNMPLDRALICQEQLQKVMTTERMYQYRMKQMLPQAQGNLACSNLLYAMSSCLSNSQLPNNIPSTALQEESTSKESPLEDF